MVCDLDLVFSWIGVVGFMVNLVLDCGNLNREMMCVSVLT